MQPILSNPCRKSEGCWEYNRILTIFWYNENTKYNQDAVGMNKSVEISMRFMILNCCKLDRTDMLCQLHFLTK